MMDFLNPNKSTQTSDIHKLSTSHSLTNTCNMDKKTKPWKKMQHLKWRVDSLSHTYITPSMHR